MASRELKRKLWSLGIFVMPVVIVQAAALILGGGGPTSAEASTSGDAPATSTGAEAPMKWTPAQLAAAKHIRELKSSKFAATPFLYQMEAEELPAIEPEPVEVVETRTKELPEFSLQAVMATDTDRQALINGRPYRREQTIRGTSWTVVSIDVERREVVIMDSTSNEQLTIRVELPR